VGHRRRAIALASLFAFLASAELVRGQLPHWAASALLNPARRPVTVTPPMPFEDVRFPVEGAVLRGWRFRTSPRRGTIVYLHGIADNRESSIGVAQRFVPLGFDVVAYDSRAHGDSTGDICTYGYHEKRDLLTVLQQVSDRGTFLIGASPGAAVALQAAAMTTRIEGVVAAESFSDLRRPLRSHNPPPGRRRRP
jgi:alpha-beta hydrolase superfamily lysophospholipase